MPAVYQYREFAAAGGLMSYGTSETEYYLLVGTYAGRVLKGDKPADLPVQQSTKVELFLNLKTAKAITVAASLRPAILDGNRSPVDPAEFAQALHKSGGPLTPG